MSFTLTAGQHQGLMMAHTLAAKPGQIGVLRGFAGTGKTTLLKVIGSELGEVTIVTPTGVAANRVAQASGMFALTIHRWRYKPKVDGVSGKLVFTPKDPSVDMQRPESGLIVIDEASMVDEKLWDDIWDAAKVLGCSVLAIGDPFQLPPVAQAETYFNMLDPAFKSHFNVTLTEVLRQALDSPIIRASMAIRCGDYMDALMDLPRVFDDQFLAKAVAIQQSRGAIICHKNTSRQWLNNTIRKTLGIEPGVLQDNEPLLILKNNYELNRFNGEVATFQGWKQGYEPGVEYGLYDAYAKKEAKSKIGIAHIDGVESALAIGVLDGTIDDKFNSGSIEGEVKRKFGKDTKYLHANFGYALTAHKSQGSEWDDVMVIMEPSIQPDTTMGRRHLYTAVTRARKNVWISYKAMGGA